MTTLRTKAAFLRGAMSVAKKFAPNIASQAGKLLHSPAVGGNLATHGLKKTVLDYAKGGAGFGALAGGALGAYGAEDGHRLEGAVKGAIPMAMQGAIGGAASGLITQPMRNLRQHAMAAKYDGAVAEKALKSTWRGNLKSMVTGKNGPRGAHAMEALAAPATVAADYVVGDKLMSMVPGGGHEQPAQQPPQRPQAYPQQVRVASALDGPQELAEAPATMAPKRIEPFVVSPFTATAGKVLVDSAIQRFHPSMVEGSLRKHVLPTIGAAALTIPAVTAVRAYNAAQAPAAPNPLDELDVDALKMYFGKQQPATQGDHHADRNH